MKRIHVSETHFSKEELKELKDCIDSNWITMGRKVLQFEESFSNYCGSRFSVACNNGTSALHLALLALGIKEGDEVILPDLTYIASANAIRYCGAKPVFCDVALSTWCLSPEDIEKKITKNTKAIMVVHLYGNPCDMVKIKEIAKEYKLAIIEDAAEAHGATIGEKKVGTFGAIGVFSFYGNKIITTGEGGVCITDDSLLDKNMRLYRGQGVDPDKRYWHKVIGYNYRMTDLQAAIGCAQIKKIDLILKKRKQISGWYQQNKPSNCIEQVVLPNARHAYWMYSMRIEGISYDTRDQMINDLWSAGVETRPVFYPLHQMPPYRDLGEDIDFPNSCLIAREGITFPTHMYLNYNDVVNILDKLQDVVSKYE